MHLMRVAPKIGGEDGIDIPRSGKRSRIEFDTYTGLKFPRQLYVSNSMRPPFNLTISQDIQAGHSTVSNLLIPH